MKDGAENREETEERPAKYTSNDQQLCVCVYVCVCVCVFVCVWGGDTLVDVGLEEDMRKQEEEDGEQ